MALPDYNMRQLLEAGVHFGHQTHRWNPKMAPYIFGDRNGIHIIALAQTVPLLHQALVKVERDDRRASRQWRRRCAANKGLHRGRGRRTEWPGQLRRSTGRLNFHRHRLARRAAHDRRDWYTKRRAGTE